MQGLGRRVEGFWSMFHGSGSRVYSLRFAVDGLRFRVEVSGSMVGDLRFKKRFQGLWIKVQASWFRVSGLEFGFQGLGLRVSGTG